MKAARWWVASSCLLLVLAAGVLADQIRAVASEAQGPVSEADVALVLGAAVWDDAPSPVFQARIDHALDLYRRGAVRQLVFTGGSRSDSVRAESAVAVAYAVARGVPGNALATEAVSRTTAQNLACSLDPLRQLEAETVVLVSDPLHLWRARWMAEDLGLDVRVSATPTTRYQSLRTQAPFLAREVYFGLAYAVERLGGPPTCPEGR